VEVILSTGLEGARHARGVVVVIDVIRSFSVSAYALAGGARECLLVPTVDQARALAARMPGSLISAEEGTLPVPGVPISNSPTQIQTTDLNGRILIQRSSAGTQVVAAVQEVEAMYAASLVVAEATVQACLLRRPTALTLIASADHPEDHACASYMQGLLRGERPDIEQLLQPLRESERFARASAGGWPGFPPTDLDLSLATDRFAFSMPVTRHADYMRLTAEPPVSSKS
jgi:2-phosphosulfolactate phosphatase